MPPFQNLPALQGAHIGLIPLVSTDFDVLFTLASDPLVWQQHPNPNRYKREEFKKFFAGALASQGAYKVVESATGAVIGCSRFYDYQPERCCVNIGYTFYGSAYWGSGYNPQAKALMLDYAFQFVATVEFHVGAGNKRSQIAMERLGAVKVAERPVTYHGELESLNFIYQLHTAVAKG